MQYISAKEAAEKWNISQRRVAILCAEGRIPESTTVGNMWLIPKVAEKPVDGRKLRCCDTQRPRLKPFVKWAGGEERSGTKNG